VIDGLSRGGGDREIETVFYFQRLLPYRALESPLR